MRKNSMNRIGLFTVVFMLMLVTVVYAIAVDIGSTIQVNNAPLNSMLNLQCGTSPGVYTVTKQFEMDKRNKNYTFTLNQVIPNTGTWYCKANFSNDFGSGPTTNEFNLVVSGTAFPVPSFTINP